MPILDIENRIVPLLDGLGQKILFGIHLILVAREGELMVINWLSFSIGEKKTGHSTNDTNLS